VALTTVLLYPLSEIAPAVSLGVLYLLAVLLVSTVWGLRLGLATSVIAALAFNFFHIPPTGRFTIAEAENWVAHATLVPAYLVPVPMALALDTPIPRDCGRAFELQEAIEQRAAAAGVTVDGRIGTGRTVRHALRRLVETEPYDRIVVAAGTAHTDGLSAVDVAWLLEHAPGEVAVLRPADESALEAAA
jgi:two-component system, OmpR family, sensor histidine kinase KdpD